MTDVIPIKKTLRPKDVVLRFMDSVGHRRDAENYLKLFTSKQSESFAIIVLDEESLVEDIDAVIFDLRYLMRLDLYPIVVIQASIETILKQDVENYFKKAKLAMNILAEELEEQDKLDIIRDRIKRKTLPLFHIRPHQDLTHEIIELAALLRTAKIIYLRREGGIADHATASQISIINLRFDKDRLLTADNIALDDKAFLRTCEKIITALPYKSYVSIVSPGNLLRELFTVKGAGTLVQMGSCIHHFTSWDQIDKARLKELLEISFGKRINENFFSAPINDFYIEENYQGAALIRQWEGMSYLSKFAVGTEARGLGIGRDLWNDIITNHKKLFWRSSPDNFITRWYQKQCDGMHKSGDWIVFWRGIGHHDLSRAVDYALEQATDFANTHSQT